MTSTHLRHRKQNKSLSPSKPPVSPHTTHTSSIGPIPPNNHPKAQQSKPHDSSSIVKTFAFTVRPLQQRSWWMRLDVAPFGVVYVALYVWEQQSSAAKSGDHKLLMATIAWILALTSHLCLFLVCQWRVSMQVWTGFSVTTLSSNKPHAWTHCWVQSTQDASVAGIVPVQYTPTNQKDDIVAGAAVIVFQDQVFRCNLQSKEADLDVALWASSLTSELPTNSTDIEFEFRPLRYPIGLPVSFYTNQWKGHGNSTNSHDTQQAKAVYGPNTTILQLPRFVDLLSEQLLAPFFLFQIFCVVLWSLDEYWYYALFTLLALLMFESTVAYNRLLSLQRLHQAGVSSQGRSILVHRASRWKSIPVQDLLPGDVVCLSMQQQHQQHSAAVPADLCLISGRVVVDEALLTGESTPQLKHSLEPSENSDDRLDLQVHKDSILFGGTNLLVCTPAAQEEGDNSKNDYKEVNGVVGIVLRTGFETAQGSLLRTMAHSSKSKDGVHTWETFVFILGLICLAVVAAAHVLQEGWYDDRRNRFRLVLHVIIIVTSVVPPELPMELSLAVTNSVSALMKRSQVFCTEHFRIPWAGQVEVCCFDKTGTLTSDEMRLRGVLPAALACDAGELDGDHMDELLVLPDNEDDPSIPIETMRIMAACHSLAVAHTRSRRSNRLQLTVVGDPLEKAVFTRTSYQLGAPDTVVNPADPSAKSIRILHRFAFTSALKRMTVIALEDGSKKGEIGKLLGLIKGAPETIKELLAPTTIPTSYDDLTYYHMSRGRRVLAMAYREVGQLRDLSYIKANGRSVVEKDLIFAGFLVLDCPIKPDTKAVISELKGSGHDCVMITGDALLTAAEVARQVGIVKRTNSSSTPDLCRLQVGRLEDVVGDVYQSLSVTPLYRGETSNLPQGLSEIAARVKDGSLALCLAGDDLIQLASTTVSKVPDDEKHLLLSRPAQEMLARLVPLISVFARHAPHHKEAVVAALNASGVMTLMCGDGTNDVGALKRAHVGISIISSPEAEAKHRQASAHLKKLQKKKKKKAQADQLQRSIVRQLQQEAQDELDEVQLGDASVAAPFTSRALSIQCCQAVVQQGRCTLVTTLSIYKILGINCLVNALVLSRLFLQGVKQGERQMTAVGLAIAGLFYFVTRAEPLPKLAPIRPPSSVLSVPALASLAGQCAVHTAAILIATDTALAYVDPYDPSLVPDGPFNPNALNTCTFLLTCWATLNTFAVNYRGRPFMEDLSDNKVLYRSLQVSYGVVLICTWQIFPPLNDMLQLSELPMVDDDSFGMGAFAGEFGFSSFLTVLMMVDTSLVFALERFIQRTC